MSMLYTLSNSIISMQAKIADVLFYFVPDLLTCWHSLNDDIERLLYTTFFSFFDKYHKIPLLFNLVKKYYTTKELQICNTLNIYKIFRETEYNL